MGRLNNIIKWIVMNVNFVYSTLGTAVIGASIFILVSHWGGLDPNFFTGWCIVGIMFGVLVVLISMLGCTGVNYQVKTTGWVTGRRILFLYQITLFLTIIADIYIVSKALTLANSLGASRDSVKAGENLAYDTNEVHIAKKFNDFFFSGQEDCTGKLFSICILLFILND
jgi:hypothetical protein